jgi:ketosteroid isomerase-like protein
MSDNIALVQSLYAAFNRGDIPFILERFTPDCEFEFEGPAEIPATGHCRGTGEMAKVFRAIAEKETKKEVGQIER